MKQYYITFRSVTVAQRGENLMMRAGWRCSLQRTPRWMEEQGCGYALRIWTDEIGAVMNVLRRERVPVRRGYLQHRDGQLEEMTL